MAAGARPASRVEAARLDRAALETLLTRAVDPASDSVELSLRLPDDLPSGARLAFRTLWIRERALLGEPLELVTE